MANLCAPRPARRYFTLEEQAFLESLFEYFRRRHKLRNDSDSQYKNFQDFLLGTWLQFMDVFKSRRRAVRNPKQYDAVVQRVSCLTRSCGYTLKKTGDPALVRQPSLPATDPRTQVLAVS